MNLNKVCSGGQAPRPPLIIGREERDTRCAAMDPLAIQGQSGDGNSTVSRPPAAPRQSNRKPASGTRHAGRTEPRRTRRRAGHLAWLLLSQLHLPPHQQLPRTPRLRKTSQPEPPFSGDRLLARFRLLWDFLVLIYSCSLFYFPSLHLEHQSSPGCLCHTRKRGAPEEKT